MANCDSNCRVTINTETDHVTINIVDESTVQHESGDILSKTSTKKQVNKDCREVPQEESQNTLSETSDDSNAKNNYESTLHSQVPPSTDNEEKGILSDIKIAIADRPPPGGNVRQAANRGYPQGGYPQGGYPQGGYPQGGYPQGGYPQGGYPQGGGYPPGGGYGQGPYPQQGYGGPDRNIGPYRMARPDEFYSEETFDAFDDEDIRKDFVRNVYTVLSLQLLFTTGMIALFTFNDDVQEWAMDNSWVMWVGMGVFLFSYLALVCYESVRRSFPVNFVFLVCLTVGMACIASYATLKYKTEIILITAGLTCLVCIIVTFVACCCPFDITGCGGVLCLIGIGVSIFGMVSMVLVVFFQMRFLILVFSGIAVALFTAYLLYDTQMIMGGKRLEMSPEEYILGSVQLYIDIIYIFIYLLPLVNACCDD